VIPLDEARAFVLDSLSPLTPRPVALDEALDCVAAESIEATQQIPPFFNSSMDGYALRSGDTEGGYGPNRETRLAVVGSIMAGSRSSVSIGPGEAARIMTGAPLPADSDAVCMLEEIRTEEDGSVVVVTGPVPAGAFVRWPGQDVELGDTVLESGSVVTPGRIGVLANQGVEHVVAHPRLRIGVLSTGDELVSGPGPLAPGQIRDANRHTLLALVKREGWDGIDLGIVGDDEEALVDALDAAATTCDVIVTSGGVSVGDLDVVRLVLDKQSGGTMRWMQVAIRPAKPFAFGLLAPSRTPVFGLPGNPVSAMVSFELFVRPAGRLLGGHRALFRLTVPALAESGFERKPDGKTHFLRSWVSLAGDGTWSVRPARGQESHQLAAMAESNALVVLPDGDGVSSGGRVDVLLLDPGRLEASAAPVGALG
jgi:molybdenum cofactor synthesis domain-containing protein